MEPKKKKYKLIYADPPWEYLAKSPPSKIEKQPETCSVSYYYDTMSFEEIKNMKDFVNELADDDCVLFLWGTTPTIEWAFEVMKEWGFKYKTMLTWEKTDKDNLGYWFKTCTEHLLVGIKGDVKAFRSKLRNCYRSPKGRHSQKPAYFRRLIESLEIEPMIELFARQKFEGWEVWGNEAPEDIQKKLF
jgi:site-specific DNA-methyltransferase (adenine-specific)